jgi:hypothetical protein
LCAYAETVRRASMKFEKRVFLILLCPALVYVLCASGVLFAYVRAHPGAPIPRWISVPIFCLFVLTILLPSFFVRRAARKQSKVEGVEEAHLRRVRAIKGMKMGLIVWGIIFLNNVRMLLQGSIPWTAAIPGSAVVALMIVVSWISLRRLQKADAASEENKQRQTL